MMTDSIRTIARLVIRKRKIRLPIRSEYIEAGPRVDAGSSPAEPPYVRRAALRRVAKHRASDPALSPQPLGEPVEKQTDVGDDADRLCGSAVRELRDHGRIDVDADDADP